MESLYILTDLWIFSAIINKFFLIPAMGNRCGGNASCSGAYFNAGCSNHVFTHWFQVLSGPLLWLFVLLNRLK